MKLRSFSKNGRPNYFQSIISLRGLLSRFVSSKLGIKRDAIIRCNGRDAYPITLINNLFMTRFSSRTTRTLRTLKIRCSMEWTAGVEWFTRLFCSSLVSPVYRLSIIINEERCNLEVARHLWRKWKIESMNGELELQLTRFSREAGYAIARKMVAVKCIHDAKHAHVTDPPKPDTRFIWEVNTCQRINCTSFMTISAFVFFFPSLLVSTFWIYFYFIPFFFLFRIRVYSFRISVSKRYTNVAIRIFSLQELSGSIDFHFHVIISKFHRSQKWIN